MEEKKALNPHLKRTVVMILVLAMAFAQMLSYGSFAASKKNPARVTISSVKAGGTNKVTIKWKKAKNANKYRVYYRKSGAKKWIKVVDTKKLSYTQKSSKARPLKANTKYQYVIKAYNTKSKKWGKLSKAKTIKTAKAAAKKTATPTQKPKATATSKPKATATTKPTAAVTNKPKATATPKPTATPTPKPTATPTPTNSPTPTPEQIISNSKSIGGGEFVSCQYVSDGPPSDVPDCTKMEYDIEGNTDCFSFESKSAINWYYIDVRGYKPGTCRIVYKYNGKILKYITVTCTSTWEEYYGYKNWRASAESEIWTSEMSIPEKLEAARMYIRNTFKYSYTKDYDGIYAWQETDKRCLQCAGAAGMMGDFARDLGLSVKYYSHVNGQLFDVETSALDTTLEPKLENWRSHVSTAVYYNNTWNLYDATPPL